MSLTKADKIDKVTVQRDIEKKIKNQGVAGPDHTRDRRGRARWNR